MGALKPCKSCGNMVSKTAEICPQCGARLKKKTSCCAVVLAILFFLVVLPIYIGHNLSKQYEGQSSELLSQEEKELQRSIIMERLSYLKKEVSEFKELKFNNDNEVYIIMKDKKIPEDYNIICNAAAFNASVALKEKNGKDTSCTVYLLSYDGAPGDMTKVLYKAYAKGGRIQESGDTLYGTRLKMNAMSPKEREAFLQDQKAQNRAGEFEKQYVSRLDGSVKPVVRYVKQSLDNPSSFEHVNTQWGIVSGETDLYWVKMTFRNKNAFNATVTNTIRVNVDFNGNIRE